MRRLLLAFLAVSVAAAGIAFAAWRLAVGDDSKFGTSEAWRGVWPQATRAEGERAQLAAHRERSVYSWQTDIDGEPVFLRYGREVLRWNRPALLLIHIPDGQDWVRRALMIRCAPGPHPDYPEIDCGLPPDRTYVAVDITAERLLRRDPSGIWIVTEVERTEFRQPAPPSDRAVRAFVSGFLERRVEGVGAEAYLSAQGRSEFGNRAQLGPLYQGHEGYEIVFVDGPLWPLGSFEVGVRLFFAGGTGEQTLFVSARTGFSEEGRRLLVIGGRPGLSGP